MMPMWIFSGVFFSYERFPEVVHPFIRALPLTALNDALRAIILQGEPGVAVEHCDSGAVGRNFVCAGAALVPLDVTEMNYREMCSSASMLR